MTKIKINFPAKCILKQDEKNAFFGTLIQKLKEHLVKTLGISFENVSIQSRGLTIYLEINSNISSDKKLGNIISTFIENYNDLSDAIGKTVRIHTRTAHKDCFIGHC